MKHHSDMCISRGKIIIIHVLAGMMMALIFGLIFGYFVMLLWNNLLPDIFGWKGITYWQGVGLVIMFRLLLGSHGYQGHRQRPKHSQAYKIDYVRKCNGPQNDYYQLWWEQEGAEAFRQYAEAQENCRKAKE